MTTTKEWWELGIVFLKFLCCHCGSIYVVIFGFLLVVVVETSLASVEVLLAFDAIDNIVAHSYGVRLAKATVQLVLHHHFCSTQLGIQQTSDNTKGLCIAISSCP